MATAARAVHCQLPAARQEVARKEPAGPVQVSVQRPKQGEPSNGKILLQPRLCNLRSYGSDPVGILKSKRVEDGGGNAVSPFFETLSEYIESSKKSQDFEIISGRLAMCPIIQKLETAHPRNYKLSKVEVTDGPITFRVRYGVLCLDKIVFAVTVAEEAVTGNSLFRKMDVQGITEAVGVCFGAVACAAFFAWFSSARTRVGRIFSLSCNTLIDSLIDQIVDGLFYESELSDWSDEI